MAKFKSIKREYDLLCERHLDEIRIKKEEALRRQWCLICQQKCAFYIDGAKTERPVLTSEQHFSQVENTGSFDQASEHDERTQDSSSDVARNEPNRSE